MIIKVHNTKAQKPLPKGARFLSASEMSELNSRLRKAMQITTRENQKKQMASMQQAAKLMLNS